MKCSIREKWCRVWKGHRGRLCRKEESGGLGTRKWRRAQRIAAPKFPCTKLLCTKECLYHRQVRGHMTSRGTMEMLERGYEVVESHLACI